MKRKLIDFWSRYKPYKLHPDDQTFLMNLKTLLDLSYSKEYGPEN